jgi:hypothetical protein
MMQAVNAVASKAISNPHRNSAVAVLFIAGCIGIIWPQIKPKTDAISHLAIVYGLLAPGNPTPQPDNKTP